ncbi:hypothetical protein D8T51_22310, partial [Vibrio vulnificus]
GFLQTPPLASDALAIRIVFPLVRVTPFSFKWTGLPALLGKQQRKPATKADFLQWAVKRDLTRLGFQTPTQYAHKIISI